METTLPVHALKPVVAVASTATVMQAIHSMVDHNVGAMVVLDGGRLVGVFTERDVVTRVVLQRRDPETTKIAEVMTTSVTTVTQDTDRTAALRLMTERHVRHLPVVDAQGHVVAMLSMRHLLRADVANLQQTVWSLVAEAQADALGG